MAKVISRYDYKVSPGETNDGELIVETAGYIPAEIKITSMIDAGRRLLETRLAYEFDPDQEVPDDYSDPTRNPGFDMADAYQLSMAANQNMINTKKSADQAKKIADEKAKIEDEKKAADAAKKD